jgi:hypothetical protein
MTRKNGKVLILITAVEEYGAASYEGCGIRIVDLNTHYNLFVVSA